MEENSWQFEDAESRFSEMVDESNAKGPQIITKDGVKVAVLLPFEHWRRLELRASPDLKEVLLAPKPRTETLVPPRPKRRWRRSPPTSK